MKIDDQKIQLINASYFIEEKLRQGQSFILCARAADERLIISSNEFNLFSPLASYSFIKMNRYALIDRKLNHLRTILMERKEVQFILCLYGKKMNQHSLNSHSVKQKKMFFSRKETHTKSVSLYMEGNFGSVGSLYIYAKSLKEILEVFHGMKEDILLDSSQII